MLAACSVCGVEYVKGYEGPCQEWLPNATDNQILSGKPRMCGGTVSLEGTAERAIAKLTEERDELQRRLDAVSDSPSHDYRSMEEALEWYAENRSPLDLLVDNGKHARAALGSHADTPTEGSAGA